MRRDAFSDFDAHCIDYVSSTPGFERPPHAALSPRPAALPFIILHLPTAQSHTPTPRQHSVLPIAFEPRFRHSRCGLIHQCSESSAVICIHFDARLSISSPASRAFAAAAAFSELPSAAGKACDAPARFTHDASEASVRMDALGFLA